MYMYMGRVKEAVHRDSIIFNPLLTLVKDICCSVNIFLISSSVEGRVLCFGSISKNNWTKNSFSTPNGRLQMHYQTSRCVKYKYV